MNKVANIARFLVGGLFIFSGLIKVNDPIGTAIKLEEYFDVFSSDIAPFFHAFIPFSLPLSVILVVFEVVLGVAILIKYRMNITVWITFGLIVFFTFLTFYSAFFNKVTDCGCFGDAIKLTPWQSFYKDLILLILIVLLVAYRKIFKGFESVPFRGDFIISTSALIFLYLAIYAIRHLPFVDFRPYKIGNDIGALMKPEEKARYQYIMTKDGEDEVFDQYPTDTSYKFKEMIVLNPEKATPKIQDYTIWNDEGDFTQASLTGTKLIVAVHSTEEVNKDYFDRINTLVLTLEKEVGVWAITSSDGTSFSRFRHDVQLAAPFYFVDATVLKAMIRSNPGILLFENGVVLGKWHYNDVPSPGDIREILQD